MCEIDRELVEMLSRSKMVLGEFYPIVIDFDDEVLAGSHREKAGWIKRIRVDTRDVARKLGVPVEVAKDIIRLHTNIQRKPSKEETAKILLRMAKALEQQGIPKEDIVSELCKYVPYSSRWIRKLLPDKYKHVEMKRNLSKFAELVPQIEKAKKQEISGGKLRNPEPELVPVTKNVTPEKDFEGKYEGDVCHPFSERKVCFDKRGVNQGFLGREPKGLRDSNAVVIRSVEELRRFLSEAPEVEFPDNVVSCPYCGRLLEVDWGAKRIRRFSGH